MFHLFDRDRVRLRALGAGHEYMLYHDAQPATVTARLVGMPIDTERLHNYIDELQTKLLAAKSAVASLMPGVNVNSGKQLGEWARATLPREVCDSWPTTPAGALKFSDDVLVNYAHLPGIREIVQAKQLATLHAAAVGWRDFINPATGRIHASLQNAQAATGHMSCFTGDTMVLTSTGEKPIMSIKVGDLVWTHQGRWRPVQAVIHNGRQSVNTNGMVTTSPRG